MSTGRHHLPTVLAVAMVAYLVAKLAHEGLGHGVACLGVGGDLQGFSTSWCMCEHGVDEAVGALRIRKAAGTGVNLLLGAAALLAVRRGPGGATGYFLWVLAAVNLLLGAGYLLTDPLFGFGDWTAFLQGLEPAAAWRYGLAGVGGVLYFASMKLLVAAGSPWFGADPDARRPRARQLSLVPYLVVGGAAMTTAAAFNRLGLDYAASSALATLGGTSGMAWLATLVDPPTSAVPSTDVQASRGWMAAGLVALVLAIGVFGRGLMLG
ncbi:MAG: hypothetical protein H6742_12910 [Alphaproteobacteria bacterium]|nr:hypothetical protein [Alphaproteobacteria bacterium]